MRFMPTGIILDLGLIMAIVMAHRTLLFPHLFPSLHIQHYFPSWPPRLANHITVYIKEVSGQTEQLMQISLLI